MGAEGHGSPDPDGLQSLAVPAGNCHYKKDKANRSPGLHLAYYNLLSDGHHQPRL